MCSNSNTSGTYGAAMTDKLVRAIAGRRRAARLVFAGVVLALLTALPASAGQHRARLSRDLADRVAAGSEQPTGVIISGTDTDIRTLPARSGARIRKKLRGGAVLDVTGGAP